MDKKETRQYECNKEEPIPKHFASAEEAGKFWNTHSAADYWDEMEEVEMEFDIQKRTFLVPLDDRIYQLVKKRAKAENRSVSDIIEIVLQREFANVVS